MSTLPLSSLDFVMRMEGVRFNADGSVADSGYVDDPLDPGGATAFGVTQETYDGWRAAQNLAPRPVREIVYPDEVQAIANGSYWNEACCQMFNDGRPRLALAQFDWSYNGGSARARRYLQAVAGVTVDGAVGPKTLAAVLACNEDAAVGRYLVLRAAHYHLRAADAHAEASRELLGQSGLASVAPVPNATQQKFLPGWLARLRWVARETGVPIDSSYAQEA